MIVLPGQKHRAQQVDSGNGQGKAWPFVFTISLNDQVAPGSSNDRQGVNRYSKTEPGRWCSFETGTRRSCYQRAPALRSPLRLPEQERQSECI